MVNKFIILIVICAMVILGLGTISMSKSNTGSSFAEPENSATEVHRIGQENLDASEMSENSTRLFFPYMDIGGSDINHGKKWFTILDTLLNSSPPDSVLVTLTTARGDSEVVWLEQYAQGKNFPNTVHYEGMIKAVYQYPPTRFDNILQLDYEGSDYLKMLYHSFNDDKLYYLQLEWY